MTRSMSCFRRGLTAAAFAAALLPTAGWAFSAEEQAEIVKAEDYLNGIGTLKAHFMQANPNGDTAEGTVYLARPGRLRLEYDPPSPILVVTHGTFLVYYDKQLEQTSYVDVDSTPAGVLVKPKVQLDQGELKVTRVTHNPGVVNVTITKREDPRQGNITLTFTEQPYQLRQWKVLDQQGQTTVVSLYDTRSGVSLDNKLFDFTDPKATVGPDLTTKGK